MKNIIVTIILIVTILTGGQTANANPTQAINEISEMDGVTSVYISKAMLSLFGGGVGKQISGVNIADIAGSLNSINIIEIEDKVAMDKAKNIINRIINAKQLELLTRIKDEEDNVNIYASVQGNITKYLLMVTDSQDQLVLIYLEGDIPLDKIAKLTSE